MLTQFLTQLKAQDKSDLTLRQIKSSLNRFAGWLENEDPHHPPSTPLGGLGLVTEIDIANFKRWLVRNYKPNTVRQTLTHVKAYFDFLVAQGVSPDNPVKCIKAPTQTKAAPKWLSRNEQNALMRAVRKYGDLRDLALITFMLHTVTGNDKILNNGRIKIPTYPIQDTKRPSQSEVSKNWLEVGNSWTSKNCTEKVSTSAKSRGSQEETARRSENLQSKTGRRSPPNGSAKANLIPTKTISCSG